MKEISPGRRLSEEDQKLLDTLSEQAYVLEDALILEMVRRKLLHLQAKISSTPPCGEGAVSHMAVSLDDKPNSSNESTVSEAIVE